MHVMHGTYRDIQQIFLGFYDRVYAALEGLDERIGLAIRGCELLSGTVKNGLGLNRSGIERLS